MSTKTKIAAAALAAVTLTTALAATSGQAHAGHRGVGIGLGIAAGALVGAAIVSNSYAQPAYVVRDCRYVERYDRWGNVRVIKICDY